MPRSRSLVIALATALLASTLLGGVAAAAKPSSSGGAGTSDPSLACNDVIVRSTTLTRDYDCGFFVGADGVTVDLGGHTVIGLTLTGRGVTVRNGIVRSGVLIEKPGATLSKLTVRYAPNSYGAAVECSPFGPEPPSLTMSSVQIVGGALGIDAFDCDLVASGTTVTGAQIGIQLQRGSAASPVRASLTNVVVESSQAHGIVSWAVPLSVSSSKVLRSGGYGLVHDGTVSFGAPGYAALTLQGSTFDSNGWGGVYAYRAYSDGAVATITNNVFVNNGFGVRDEFSLPAGGLVIEDLTAGSQIKGNTANYNYRGFLAVAGGPIASSGNVARFNTFEGFSAPNYAGVFSASSTDRCFGNSDGTTAAQDDGHWVCNPTTR